MVASRATVVDAAGLGALAVALRVPALLSTHHLTPDDGIYLMSADAMRHGSVPFRDVFSSQGPLYLPLVFVGDLVRRQWSPRVAGVVAGVAVTLLTYAIARRMTGRVPAVLAGVVVTASASLLWVTGPLASDGPTAALVAATFLLTLRYDERPSRTTAAGIGLAGGAAMLVKTAIGILGALPALVVLVRHRRGADMGAASGTALALGLAATLPFGARDVWDQTVSYQLDSRRERSVGGNVVKVVRTLVERDPAVVALVLVALLAAAFLVATGRATSDRRVGSGTTSPTTLLLVWLIPTLAFLVAEPALWRPHISALVVPLVLLAVTRPVPWPWLVAVTVAVAPFQMLAARSIVDPPDLTRPERRAVTAIAAGLPPGAQVVSDDVGLVWDARRRTPDDLVDTSIKQLQQGRIDTQEIVTAARRPRVCGVLVWRGAYFAALPGLRRAIRAAGYVPIGHFQEGSSAVLWGRVDCPVGPLRIRNDGRGDRAG